MNSNAWTTRESQHLAWRCSDAMLGWQAWTMSTSGTEGPKSGGEGCRGTVSGMRESSESL